MNNYEILTKDLELKNIIDNINEINKDTLMVCHGRYHTTFVINTIEYILTKLNFDTHIIELGKIAGILHDIGVIKGKKCHAKNSAIMSEKFLNKSNLSSQEKIDIMHAIEDHSKGENINSPIGAALLIADKVNVAENRVLELGKKSNSFMIGIEEVKLQIYANTLNIDYIVNERFDKNIFLNEHKISAIIKASNYLGLDCVFNINGEIINFN